MVLERISLAGVVLHGYCIRCQKCGSGGVKGGWVERGARVWRCGGWGSVGGTWYGWANARAWSRVGISSMLLEPLLGILDRRLRSLVLRV